MTRHKNTKVYQGERKWFLIVSSALFTVFILYIYFISASVVHVVIRKEIDQDIARMSSHVSSLESKYIEAQHSISADIASLAGYQETSDKVFITRTQTSLVLSDANGS